jgi:hypothetical protein
MSIITHDVGEAELKNTSVGCDNHFDGNSITVKVGSGVSPLSKRTLQRTQSLLLVSLSTKARH